MPIGQNDPLAALRAQIDARLKEMADEAASSSVAEAIPGTMDIPDTEMTPAPITPNTAVPQGTFGYLFGLNLPTAETNAMGQPVHESSQVAAGFGNWVHEITGGDFIESQTDLQNLPFHTRNMIEGAQALKQAGAQAVGSLIGAAAGFADFVGTGVVAPAARVLGQSFLPVESIKEFADRAGVTTDQWVDGETTRLAMNLNMEPDTLKALLPDEVFKDIIRPAESGQYEVLQEGGGAAYNFAKGFVEYPYFKLQELASGDVLTDPFGMFFAATGAKHGAKAGYKRVQAYRKTQAAAKQVLETPVPNINETIQAEVAAAVGPDGRLQVGSAPVPRVMAEAASKAMNEVVENGSVPIGGQLKLVFDTPGEAGQGAPRGVFIPDALRVSSDGTLAYIIRRNDDGSVIARKQNGQYEVMAADVMSLDHARDVAIPLPDPVAFGKLYPDMAGVVIHSSELATAARAGVAAREFTRNPALLKSIIEGDQGGMGAAAGRKFSPTEQQKRIQGLGDVIRKELDAVIPGLSDMMVFMDDNNYMNNPQYLHVLDTQRQRIAAETGIRVPIWTMSGFGLPMKLKAVTSALSVTQGVLRSKITSAYDRMGVVSLPFLERVGNKLAGDGQMKARMEAFRTETMPWIREPSEFLQNHGFSKAALSKMARHEMIDIVVETPKIKAKILEHLDNIGRGPDAFDAFVEGAKEIGFVNDTVFWLNSITGDPSLNLNQFRNDYLTHIKAAADKAKPGQLLSQVVNEASLPESIKPWYSYNRRKEASAISKGIVDPVMQDLAMLDANMKTIFLNPLKNEFAAVEGFMKDGMTVDLMLEPHTKTAPIDLMVNFKPTPVASEALLRQFKQEKFVPEMAAGDGARVMGKGETLRFVGRKELNNGVREFVFEALDTDAHPIGERKIRVPDSVTEAQFWENFVTRAPEQARQQFKNYTKYHLLGTNEPIGLSARAITHAYNAVSELVPSAAGKAGLGRVHPNDVQNAMAAVVGTLYAKHLGLFRVSSALKNLTQAPTLGASIVGGHYYLKGMANLKDPHLRYYVDQLAARQAPHTPVAKIADGGPRWVETMKHAADDVQSSLVLFGMADTVNRVSTQAGAFMKVMEQKENFVPNIPNEPWNNLIRQKIKEGKYEQAGIIYAHAAEAMSQWWYSKMNRPELLLNKQFLSIFGTWPLNYGERIAGNSTVRRQRARELVAFGEKGVIEANLSPFSNPQVANSLRYLLTTTALIAGGKAAGIDIENWFLAGPLPTGIGAGLDTVEAGVGLAQSAVSMASGNQEYASRQFAEAWRDILSMTPLPYENVDGELEPWDFVGGTGVGRDLRGFAETGDLRPIIFGSGATGDLRRSLNKLMGGNKNSGNRRRNPRRND